MHALRRLPLVTENVSFTLTRSSSRGKWQYVDRQNSSRTPLHVHRAGAAYHPRQPARHSANPDLFLTDTRLSVPALMGSIMCMGVATANSILVVSFARGRLDSHRDALQAAIEAGFTRFRPVIMTALAMIIGMIPMALSMGEGGEQNAPLGRAVIGGLILATITTLFVVPLVYSMLRTKPPVDHERRIVEEEHEYLRDEMLLGEDLQ